MFSYHYFWFFIIVQFCVFCQQRCVNRMPTLPPIIQSLFYLLSILGSISYYVFLILGFWYMPHWWYPLAMICCGTIISSLIPVPDFIAAFVGIIAIPVCSILMYLDLFYII